MSEAAVSTPESILRPLILAAIGSGVVALSLLQFSADALPLLDGEGKLAVARAIRAAFFAFLGCASALLVAYLTGSWKSARLTLAFNLYGATAFIFGATMSGGHVGAALRTMAGERMMPPALGLFFLFNMVAVLALGAAAILSVFRVRRLARHERPQMEQA